MNPLRRCAVISLITASTGVTTIAITAAGAMITSAAFFFPQSLSGFTLSALRSKLNPAMLWLAHYLFARPNVNHVALIGSQSAFSPPLYTAFFRSILNSVESK